jgi:homoserine dehydrogenase
MKQYRVCFIGFGNVGRALARLLSMKAADLASRYEIECKVTGVASRTLGWLAQADGFAATELSAAVPTGETSNDAIFGGATKADGIREWLELTKPDAVFETTSLNHETGQPAIEYLKAVLNSGAHAITANKGAVVYGYDELSELADRVGKKFFFESTVADSAPVFSLFRETLPAVNLRGFSALLSSTCNLIIEAMEAGRTFDEGVGTAQELGVTETDPSHDVDGWDATVKVCALSSVLMSTPLVPSQVKREGIRGLTSQVVQAARAEGKPYKLVARAQRLADGSITSSVRPEQVGLSEPLGNVRGTSLAVHFELDMMPGLTITSHRPNLQSTAYGLLADFINAVKTPVQD